ncbi:MAG: class I SAM-dependent methyltransferase [Patescibacteria group bacterium]
MKKQPVKIVKHCRTCKSTDLKKIFSLGDMPMVNNFLTSYQLDQPELKFPLTVVFCPKCGMVETLEVVNPSLMYTNYVYISTFSKTMADHFDKLAQSLIARFGMTSRSLVVEMGSNDGLFLKKFKKYGVKVLGVDPAKNLAKIANQEGIETLDTFFSKKIADKIVKEKGQASLVIGTNVFAHIDDLDDVLKGLNVVLKDDGIFVAEFPYLVDLVQGVQFDTIYHEHLSYFSMKPLAHLFKRFNLELFDVERTPVHGGSVIIYVKRKGAESSQTARLKRLLVEEERLGIHEKKTLDAFAKKVLIIKRDLNKLLIGLKKRKKKVVGFGAPAKGNILLNYCGIDGKLIDYLTDNIPYKHGLYAPRTHLQVFPQERVAEEQPDYLLLLPWNFKKEILRKLASYRKKGGKVIIPIPKVEII